MVIQHIEAENRHEASIATFYTPRYQVFPMSIIHDGEQAVVELLSGMFKGFRDFAVVIIKTHHSDDAVILELRMKGTHLGDWAGLKPTGRLMDTDRLVCEKVYFDLSS